MYANVKELAMITLDSLKHHPQHIPSLAKIWLDTAGKKWAPHITFEKATERFQNRPITLMHIKL